MKDFFTEEQIKAIKKQIGFIEPSEEEKQNGVNTTVEEPNENDTEQT